MFKFEVLPNELVIEVLKYLNTRDLFQSFFNLNFRFNSLIISLNHLIYSTNKNDNNIQSYPYIRILIINTEIQNKLNPFSNIYRLILDYVTDDLISQLNSNVLPRLEYISINPKVHPFYMSDLRQKIFSNTFPQLKFSYISRMKPSCAIQPWTQTLSLRYLKVNDIDLFIYISILSSCPNLYFLKFKLSNQTKIQPNSILHTKLKRLIIDAKYDQWPWNDEILKQYLVCVPKLEQLKIYRSLSSNSNMMEYFQNYNWLLSTVASQLLSLCQFRFDLYITRSIDLNFEEICFRLKNFFNNVYKNRYESRLVVF